MKNNPTLKLLKSKRKERNLTIKEVAKKVGVSKSLYSYLENGNKRLSYDQAVRIADVFNTTPDELFLESYKEFF